MADIVPIRTTRNGVVITPVSAAVGKTDLCPNTKRVLVIITNGGGTNCVVTVPAVKAICGDLTAHDEVTTIGAGVTKYIGPFNRDMYNNSAGKISVVYDQVTSITISAIEVVD